MPVRTERRIIISCDGCGDGWGGPLFPKAIAAAQASQRGAIFYARMQGWKMGKKVTCPECQKKEGNHASTG